MTWVKWTVESLIRSLILYVKRRKGNLFGDFFGCCYLVILSYVIASSPARPEMVFKHIKSK